MRRGQLIECDSMIFVMKRILAAKGGGGEEKMFSKHVVAIEFLLDHSALPGPSAFRNKI